MPQPDSDTTNLSLLKRVQDGDEKAWHLFNDVYRPLVLFWCQRLGVASRDCEDVSQEVYIAVQRTIRSFKKDRPFAFRGWLRTITVNKIRDYRKKQHRNPAILGENAWLEQLQSLEAEEESPMPPSQMELLRQIRQFVQEKFAEKTWKAFQLFAVEKMPAAEVAELLGMTEVAIRVAKARIMKRLNLEFGDLL